jgi:hypothetical protein
VDKYKEFETWAKEHGWFFANQRNLKHETQYNWLSPLGLCFIIAVDGDKIKVYNDFSNSF